MNCHCCDAAVSLARRVVILDLVADVEQNPPSPYRTAFVCQACYECLDTTDGVGEVAGRLYMLDSHSRFGKAPLYTAEMFEDWLRAKAVKLEADAK